MIAHEVGHHVQRQLGTSDAVQEAGREGGELRTWGGRLLALGTGGRGRFARNAVVQGAAAELFKVWAATVRGGGGRIVLCLHDELLLHVPERDAADAVALVHDALEEAAGLARICALNGLAAVDALVGLDAVAGVVKVVGFVASAPGFTGQPGVLNGASDLLAEVFGEAGRHARSAVGVAELPLGAPVEVELVVALS